MNISQNLLGPDDKTVPVMIYTHQRIIWGNLVSRKTIRVTTWLKTEMAPNFLSILDAQIMLFGAGDAVGKMKFPILHVQKGQIIAYHILPPADESPYYDENIPNRRMEPVTIIAGIFRFDGFLRLAEQTDLYSYLTVHKEDFLSVYDLTMTCPLIPSLEGIRVPFGMINQIWAVVAEKIVEDKHPA